jgi:aryl-alcohol dehydrogenase-like predicted oxidoreductase
MISAENKPEILSSALGGNFTLPGTEVSVNRMGYGAMQLAGPGVWGPPRDADAAVAVLREAVESGVNHIDTNDFYGPHVTPMQIALAWLLQRSPNILLIPGTSRCSICVKI